MDHMGKYGWLFIGIVIKAAILHTGVGVTTTSHFILFHLTHKSGIVARLLTNVTLVPLMTTCSF